MSTASVVLILGAGPNVGHHVVTLFMRKGYKVASASRSRQNKIIDDMSMDLHVDLSLSESISEVFDQLRSLWVPPSLVIYNGAMRTLCDPIDPFASFSLESFNRETAVNMTSAFITAQQAVLGFNDLPSTSSKTFFYTGNKLNVMSDPRVIAFGMGKNAAAHMIWNASTAYRKQGYKFYYTDELFADGTPMRDQMGGEARANLYLGLAEAQDQGPWHCTFVKGHGFKDFGSIDRGEESRS